MARATASVDNPKTIPTKIHLNGTMYVRMMTLDALRQSSFINGMIDVFDEDMICDDMVLPLDTFAVDAGTEERIADIISYLLNFLTTHDGNEFIHATKMISPKYECVFINSYLASDRLRTSIRLIPIFNFLGVDSVFTYLSAKVGRNIMERSNDIQLSDAMIAQLGQFETTS